MSDNTVVEQAFVHWDGRLKLDKTTNKQAIDRHNEVAGVLSSSGLITGHFLQGSFARKTMLPPLKDVDMVVLLTSANAELSPSEAMASTQTIMTEQFPQAAFDPDKAAAKALQVQFPTDAFTIDVVVAHDLANALVLIGNRDTSEWEPSHSRILRKLISDRNSECDGRFVHQVRMLKAIKNHAVEPALDKVCGLVMETLAFHAIPSTLPHSQAVAYTLATAPVLLEGPLLDPSEENDLTQEWDAHTRQRILAGFAGIADTARRTLAFEKAGRYEDALSSWADLCGPDFPSMTMSSALRDLNRYGQNATGGVAAGPRQAAINPGPVSAWRQP